MTQIIDIKAKAIQKAIPTIVGNDARITIEQIKTKLDTDHGIGADHEMIQKAIDAITENGIRSFNDCPDVKKGHADHMNRFMLLETKFRLIKSIRRVVNAGNSAKYSVAFYASNGAVSKFWIGVQWGLKQIVFGCDSTGLGVYSFDDLQNRGEKQSSTVAWILSEFPDDGMAMATDFLNNFQFTIEFPTVNHLNTFHGFQCVGQIIGGSKIDGQIDAATHRTTDPQMVGINSSIFVTWSSLSHITIFAKY